MEKPNSKLIIGIIGGLVLIIASVLIIGNYYGGEAFFGKVIVSPTTPTPAPAPAPAPVRTGGSGSSIQEPVFTPAPLDMILVIQGSAYTPPPPPDDTRDSCKTVYDEDTRLVRCEGTCSDTGKECSLFPTGQCHCAISCDDNTSISEVACGSRACSNTGSYCYQSGFGSNAKCKCDADCGEEENQTCWLANCPLKFINETIIDFFGPREIVDATLIREKCLRVEGGGCDCGTPCDASNFFERMVPCEDRICSANEYGEKTASCYEIRREPIEEDSDYYYYDCMCIGCEQSAVVRTGYAENPYLEIPCYERTGCNTMYCDQSEKPVWEDGAEGEKELSDGGRCGCYLAGL